MSQPMSPELFNNMNHEEQKSALASYITDVDTETAQRSCGDGREATNADGAFIKNFGGSLGPATVRFIDQWSAPDKDTKLPTYGESVEQSLADLEARFDLGGHRDDHSHESDTSSGCGYADNRTAIVHRIARTENLKDIVNGVFKNAINEQNEDVWADIIDAYNKIDEKQAENTELTPSGEELISLIESNDTTTLELKGSHKEYAVVFNFAKNKTLDTNKLVEDGGSAFCVDVWDALDQSNHLGVDEDKAELIYMAEWVATALVLVIDKDETKTIEDLPPIHIISDEYLRKLGQND